MRHGHRGGRVYARIQGRHAGIRTYLSEKSWCSDRFQLKINRYWTMWIHLTPSWPSPERLSASMPCDRRVNFHFNSANIRGTVWKKALWEKRPMGSLSSWLCSCGIGLCKPYRRPAPNWLQTVMAIHLMMLRHIPMSRHPERIMEYLDKHDGEYWRYKYFTRPVTRWIAGVPRGEGPRGKYQYWTKDRKDNN